jgi:hypothetical protein
MKENKPWGKKYAPSMLITSTFCCPNPKCATFSFFCNGDFDRPAAVIWRQSVVGFIPSNNGHAEMAGIAVLDCQHCRQLFGVFLGEQVIPIYQEQCDKWPRQVP